MHKKNASSSFTKFVNLYKEGKHIGKMALEYQVSPHDDLNANIYESAYLPLGKKYNVICTQRFIISNESSFSLDDVAVGAGLSFSNYLAALNASISIRPQQGMTKELLDYSPRTVNSKVSQSNAETNTSQATAGGSVTNTVGSSTSQSNSFGASTSLSDPFGSSANYESSSTTTVDQSHSVSQDKSKTSGNDHSGSASMSIKDWGIYSAVDTVNNDPRWVLGQEYPWDTFSCKSVNTYYNPEVDPSRAFLITPGYMNQRLVSYGILLPPSQLSLYGIDFTLKCNWLVTLADDGQDQIVLDHHLELFTASHYSDSISVNDGNDTIYYADVYIDQYPAPLIGEHGTPISTVLNLRLMALDQIGANNAAATVGFLINRFIVAPLNDEFYQSFTIISATNDLLIRDTTDVAPLPGTGFSNNNLNLIATLSSQTQVLQFTAYFKIVDYTFDYTLFMKHWIVGDAGVCLSIFINNNKPIVKYITTQELQGGENNLTSISLRSNDFSSADFNDYLQLGLNSIVIQISPSAATQPEATYQLRALSIEKH